MRNVQPMDIRPFIDAIDGSLPDLAVASIELVLAHEIGDAVYKLDRDQRIDEDDAWDGVFMAADIVGRKHLEPGIFQAVRSNRYRSILRRIADTGPFDAQFKRSDLLARLRDDERRVLDTFLRRMRELGVIQRDPEAGRGAYRFDNRLCHVYVRISWRCSSWIASTRGGSRGISAPSRSLSRTVRIEPIKYMLLSRSHRRLTEATVHLNHEGVSQPQDFGCVAHHHGLAAGTTISVRLGEVNIHLVHDFVACAENTLQQPQVGRERGRWDVKV